jgi:hypothetical protein
VTPIFKLAWPMRSSILLPLISVLAAGCVRTQTMLVNPAQPIRLIAAVEAPPKTTATEVAVGQWVVNDGAVILPAGAYVVVLSSSTEPSTRP